MITCSTIGILFLGSFGRAVSQSISYQDPTDTGFLQKIREKVGLFDASHVLQHNMAGKIPKNSSRKSPQLIWTFLSRTPAAYLHFSTRTLALTTWFFLNTERTNTKWSQTQDAEILIWLSSKTNQKTFTTWTTRPLSRLYWQCKTHSPLHWNINSPARTWVRSLAATPNTWTSMALLTLKYSSPELVIRKNMALNCRSLQPISNNIRKPDLSSSSRLTIFLIWSRQSVLPPEIHDWRQESAFTETSCTGNHSRWSILSMVNSSYQKISRRLFKRKMQDFESIEWFETCKRCRIGLVPKGPTPRSHAEILDKNGMKEVGMVTSGSPSPTLSTII